MGTSPSLFYAFYFVFEELILKKERGRENRSCGSCKGRVYFKITAVCLRQRHDTMISLIAVMIRHNEWDQSESLSLFYVVKLPKSKMQIQTRSFNEPTQSNIQATGSCCLCFGPFPMAGLNWTPPEQV